MREVGREGRGEPSGRGQGEKKTVLARGFRPNGRTQAAPGSTSFFKAYVAIFYLLRLSPTTPPKIQDPFVLWIALQAKGSIPIRYLLQQHDPKKNPFYKWVSRREDAYIWVVPLRQPKIGLPYRYSVGG